MAKWEVADKQTAYPQDQIYSPEWSFRGQSKTTNRELPRQVPSADRQAVECAAPAQV